MNRSLMLLPAAVLILAGCGGDSGDSTGTDEASSGASESAGSNAGSDSGTESDQAEPKPRAPIDVADDLASQIDPIRETTEITEDNDPNDLIGRPGGYIAAAVIEDDRLPCDNGLGADCGATIEQFETPEAAQERSDYIQGLMGADGPLGTEYNYVDGDLLLRVTGELKPSEAEEYEAAFTG